MPRSRDRWNGTRAKRSPGSALKPFIYGLGIDQGIIHPLTMLKDAPMSFGSYNPENFDNDFVGPIKARDALVKSRNVPAVEIVSKLTAPGLHGFLLKAGITRMREDLLRHVPRPGKRRGLYGRAGAALCHAPE